MCTYDRSSSLGCDYSAGDDDDVDDDDDVEEAKRKDWSLRVIVGGYGREGVRARSAASWYFFCMVKFLLPCFFYVFFCVCLCCC